MSRIGSRLSVASVVRVRRTPTTVENGGALTGPKPGPYSRCPRPNRHGQPGVGMRGVATGIAVLVVWTAAGCGGASSGGAGGHGGGGSSGQGGAAGSGAGAGGSSNL